MKNTVLLSAALGIASAQVITWCKDEDCSDCPSSVISGESRVPECVIYDTNTVFGGQGFNEGSGGNLLYEVFGNYADAPCGADGPGAILIRSPATLATQGCGLLKKWRNEPGCDRSPIQLEDTFMVQYCCGFEECAELEIPHDKKRNIAIGGHTPRSSSSGLGISARGSGSGGLYLQFNNGTIIPPKEVGYPPESLAARAAQKMTRRCDGWEENSYEHAPENKEYYKTFETDIVGDAVAPSTEDRTITVSHARSVERRTTFSLEVGDPWGIVTASVGYEFATTETQEISYELLIPAGVGGQVGYTPVYVCTRGTLRDCDGNTFDGEACTALLDPQTGKIRGEWQIVEA